MKAFLVSFFMVFAAYPMTFAGTLSCQGPAWVSSVFFPIPLKRLADVTIKADGFEANRGSVTISIGGDPLNYRGPLYLDGTKDHVVINELGEKAQFRLKVGSAKNGPILGFSQQMLSASNEVALSVRPTTLNCILR